MTWRLTVEQEQQVAELVADVLEGYGVKAGGTRLVADIFRELKYAGFVVVETDQLGPAEDSWCFLHGAIREHAGIWYLSGSDSRIRRAKDELQAMFGPVESVVQP